jgi:kanamycin nucleotidyltransferase
MHCILHGQGVNACFEWSAGPWKAEVDVYSADVLLRWAAELDVFWPITHGAAVMGQPLYDPTGFFPRLRQAALDHPAEAFEKVIKDVIVGAIYELVGKLRNAAVASNLAVLPYFAVDLAKAGACLVGLANRHLYTTTSQMWAESLALPGSPEGYKALVRLVMSGRLDRPARITQIVDGFWEGVERWAVGRGLELTGSLENLLGGDVG